MKNIAANREALDLLRINSQLIRQIREVHDRVVAIEQRHHLTETSCYAELSQEFRSAGLDGDIVTMRMLNQRLRHELSSHRRYLARLKVEVRERDRSNRNDLDLDK